LQSGQYPTWCSSMPITGITTSVLCGHTHAIRSLAFSPDGTLLVSRSDDETVKLWDVQTAESLGPSATTLPPFQLFRFHQTALRSLWEPGMERSACVCPDWEVSIHRNVSGQCSNSHQFLTYRLSALHIVIGAHNYTAVGRRWSSNRNFHHEGDEVEDLAYASDGTRFVSCGGEGAVVRDSESGAAVAKLEATYLEPLYRCCISPDGRFVACAAVLTIYVWDVTISGPRLAARLVGHYNTVSFLTFSSPSFQDPGTNP